MLRWSLATAEKETPWWLLNLYNRFALVFYFHAMARDHAMNFNELQVINRTKLEDNTFTSTMQAPKPAEGPNHF